MQRLLDRGPTIALVCLAVLQLALVFLYVGPGPFTIDEVLYHRMTHGLVNGQGFFLWNGYEEVATHELVGLQMRNVSVNLTAPYPYGYPILAAPAYVLFGYRGLFLPNALAMVGCAALTYRIALRLLGNRGTALCSGFLFAFATYATDYGLAMWPHMTALFFILGAFMASLCALDAARSSRAEWAWAAVAGALLGFGGTVRVDVYLAVPVLGAFFLFTRPTRWRSLWAFGLGLLPGMLFNSLVNAIRWGTFSPASYGVNSSARLVVVAVGVLLVVAAWLFTRRPVSNWLLQKHRGVLLAVLTLVVLFAVPRSRAAVLEFTSGAFALLVDARALPDDRTGVLSRGEHEGIFFQGGAGLFLFKRAVLQSCPFLCAALIPFWLLVRRKERARKSCLLLAALPLSYGAFYSYGTWHGGVSVNMRYLLPLLPFLCILSANTFERLVAPLPRWSVALATAAVLCTFLIYGMLAPPLTRQHGLELFLLFAPLGIAGVTLLSLVVWVESPKPLTASVALAALAIAVGWSAAQSFQHDVKVMREIRAMHGEAGRAVAEHIEDDSLLVLEMQHSYSSVFEYRPHVRMAFPLNDEYKTTGKLIEYHLAHKRRTYGLMSPTQWGEMHRRFKFCFRLIARFGVDTLAEIRANPRPGTPCPRN